MKKLFTKLTLLFIGILGLASLAPAPVFAEDPCTANVPAPVKEAAGCNTTSDKGGLSGIIKNILIALISVAGIVAVVFIIIGGVQYMTSNGDAGKLTKAKSTIIYSVIGLVVCVLSFAIVNFVIDGIIGSAGSGTPSSSSTPSP